MLHFALYPKDPMVNSALKMLGQFKSMSIAPKL